MRRGEDPAEAIVRELREETGLEIRVLGLLAVRLENPRHLTLVYAPRVTGGAFRASDEVTELRYVTPGEWPNGPRENHRALIRGFAAPDSGAAQSRGC